MKQQEAGGHSPALEHGVQTGVQRTVQLGKGQGHGWRVSRLED
jgi:hypothetical protein